MMNGPHASQVGINGSDETLAFSFHFFPTLSPQLTQELEVAAASSAPTGRLGQRPRALTWCSPMVGAAATAGSVPAKPGATPTHRWLRRAEPVMRRAGPAARGAGGGPRARAPRPARLAAVAAVRRPAQPRPVGPVAWPLLGSCMI